MAETTLSLKDRIKSGGKTLSIKRFLTTLDESVYVRLLTKAEIMEVYNSLDPGDESDKEGNEEGGTTAGEKVADATTQVVGKHILDDEGNRIWSDSDEDQSLLKDVPLPIIREMFQALMEVNVGQSPEDAEKNLKASRN